MHFLPLPVFLLGIDEVQCHGRVEISLCGKEDTEEICCNKQTEFLMPQSVERKARDGEAVFHTTSQLCHGEEGVEGQRGEGRGCQQKELREKRINVELKV